MPRPLLGASSLAVCGALALLLGCGSGRRSAEPKLEPAVIAMDPVAVDTGYGTLSFRGMIERTDRGSEIEYRTHIDVTFRPNAGVNRTPVVALREWRFVATVPGAENGPWKALYQDSRPMSVRLTQDGESAHLPDVVFRLSKAIAAQARRVGLSVNDGHLLWPIPVDLQ